MVDYINIERITHTHKYTTIIRKILNLRERIRINRSFESVIRKVTQDTKEKELVYVGIRI